MPVLLDAIDSPCGQERPATSHSKHVRFGHFQRRIVFKLWKNQSPVNMMAEIWRP